MVYMLWKLYSEPTNVLFIYLRRVLPRNNNLKGLATIPKPFHRFVYRNQIAI